MISMSDRTHNALRLNRWSWICESLAVRDIAHGQDDLVYELVFSCGTGQVANRSNPAGSWCDDF